MDRPLRVGVVGLGPNWQHGFRQALLTLRRRLAVRAAWDQTPLVAQAEARQLGCVAADGIRELIESDDVEAVLLLDPQWCKLWPLEAACQFRKPALCVPSLDIDPDRAGVLCQTIAEGGLPVHFAPLPRHCPATRRLLKLMEARLGLPQVLLAHACVPRLPAIHGGVSGEQPQACSSSLSLGALVDWCIHVMDTPPLQVQVHSLQTGCRFLIESMLLQFPEERSAQITLAAAGGASAQRAVVRADIIADSGRAELTLPDQIRWSDGAAERQERFPVDGFTELSILRRFHRLVTGSLADVPSVMEARLTLSVLQAAAESKATGKAAPVRVDG